ncbi:MAG: hypothetical protein II411_06520 [Lachnospiraceae bacterium]|nr:hypothetical protein [Lachnospiraceae bacterium]
MYLLIHLLCAVISILMQNNDSNYLDIGLTIIYVITGPFGLVAKLFTKII